MASGELSNNAKAQLKKTLHQVISDFEPHKANNVDEDVHFLHLKHHVEQLQAALATQQNQKYKYKKFKYESPKEMEEEGVPIEEVVIEIDEQ